MVFTIHRYIFFDLVKTFCQATVILSVILGLGVILQPLRQFGVDPLQVPKLIAYTFPITLSMVIPIAALLSATLNYGRLSHFNEINACRTSGIKLLNLIYPAAAFALLVGLTTLLLGFHVVPSFTKKFERTITADAEAIIFRNIQKRGDLGGMFPNVRIYADHAIPEEHRLVGVVVLQLDKKDILWTVTAEQVELEFRMDQPQKQVLLRMHQATLLSDDQTVYFPNPEPMVKNIPSLWQDNIKFKKLEELRNIQNDMSQFGPIRRALDEFQQQFLWEAFYNDCNRQANQNNSIFLSKDGVPIRIITGGCRIEIPQSKSKQKNPFDNRKAELIGVNQKPIEVILPYESPSANPNQIYQAQKAWLSFMELFPNNPPLLVFKDIEKRNNELSSTTFLRDDVIEGIDFPLEIINEAQAISVDNIRTGNVLERLDNPTPCIQLLENRIIESCDELIREIMIEKHSRLAFGISCVVLVLLGTVLGIVMKSSHLLMAFGVSFIPAAFCLITIFTGKHIAEKTDTQTMGIVFLWSGVFLVAVADLLIYKHLAKN
ncbi:MAG: LptF/LptG family permease [Planctomycetes bacterium]|nr:LptF/LptG family permease [Planctomycetota bacterium]